MGAGSVVGIGVIGAWMTALCTYDVRERRLPNWLTLPGAGMVLAAGVIAGRGLATTTGALTLFGLYLVVHLVSPRAMGGGDVKLALGLGGLTAMFGVDVWVLASMGAPLVTALCGLAALPWRRGGSLPHGPSMCLSSAGALALVMI